MQEPFGGGFSGGGRPEHKPQAPPTMYGSLDRLTRRAPAAFESPKPIYGGQNSNSTTLLHQPQQRAQPGFPGNRAREPIIVIEVPKQSGHRVIPILRRSDSTGSSLEEIFGQLRPESMSHPQHFRRSAEQIHHQQPPNREFYPQNHFRHTQQPQYLEPSFGRQAITPPPSFGYPNDGRLSPEFLPHPPSRHHQPLMLHPQHQRQRACSQQNHPMPQSTPMVVINRRPMEQNNNLNCVQSTYF